MEFPRLVYKVNGKELEYVLVANEQEMWERLSTVWYASVPEAMNPRPVITAHIIPAMQALAEAEWGTIQEEPIEPPVQPEDDDAPPTRAELEAKADELGIRYDGRTTDKRLKERIEDKLNEDKL